MSAGFTPGPWAAELGRNGSFSIEAERGGIANGLLVLASRNEHPLMADQMHANARLIAAAPELLEALKSLVHSLDESDLIHDDQRQAFNASKAAIAKATGQS
jgi:hypothetical protein